MDAPTEPDWYWWRHDADAPWECVHITTDAEGLLHASALSQPCLPLEGWQVCFSQGEWAARIPQPPSDPPEPVLHYESGKLAWPLGWRLVWMPFGERAPTDEQQQRLARKMRAGHAAEKEG